MTLVDRKDYFEVSWAALRSMVEGAAHGATITALHTEYLAGKAKFVLGELEHVAENSVILLDGTCISFDFLVISTGNEGGVGKSVQTTRADRLAYFEAEAQLLAAASSVLIIGGGPAGIELAGEIKTDHPTLMVTLVHSGPALMAGGMTGSALSAHLSKQLTKRLSRMGVLIQTGAHMPRNTDGDWVANADIFSSRAWPKSPASIDLSLTPSLTRTRPRARHPQYPTSCPSSSWSG